MEIVRGKINAINYTISIAVHKLRFHLNTMPICVWECELFHVCHQIENLFWSEERMAKSKFFNFLPCE